MSELILEHTGEDHRPAADKKYKLTKMETKFAEIIVFANFKDEHYVLLCDFVCDRSAAAA